MLAKRVKLHKNGVIPTETVAKPRYYYNALYQAYYVIAIFTWYTDTAYFLCNETIRGLTRATWC